MQVRFVKGEQNMYITQVNVTLSYSYILQSRSIYFTRNFSECHGILTKIERNEETNKKTILNKNLRDKATIGETVTLLVRHRL